MGEKMNPKNEIDENQKDDDIIDLSVDDIDLVTEEIYYKFNENLYVEELQEVIDRTYGGHYSREQFQATEFIIDGGHGSGFCIGNIMKYAQRYGKKGTREDARKDILKVLHYAITRT
jgi:hypothetical protein